MPEVTMAAKSWTYGKDSREGGRPTQEDRCETMEFRTADGQQALLALVADGVGGRNAGELASQWAKEMIPAALSLKQPSASEVPAVLVEAFEDAHTRIYNEVLDNPSRAGMGTTCTAVVIIGQRLYLAHVGDSRAYLIRGNQIHQLSIDHTWAEEAIAAGRSPEELRNHPNRGVIKRCLGVNEEVNVDTRYRKFGEAGEEESDSHPVHLEDGDRILLCTDGVSDVLSDAQLLDIVRHNSAAEDRAARAVVQAALKVDAKDNVTAVVVDLPGAVVAGGRPTLWRGAIISVVALLLLIVGAGAAFVLLPRPPQPTSVPGTSTSAPVVGITSAATMARPVATATPLPATRLAMVAPVASAPPTVLAGGPTITPIATFTAAPTATSAPTAPPVEPVARQTSAPAVPSKIRTPLAPPALVAPPDGDTRNGEVEFKWQPGESLPDGTGYEVVWWMADKSSDTARGFADPVVETSLKTNLDGALGGQQQTIRWTVLIVGRYPYTRLIEPSVSNSRTLIYSPRGDGSCTGHRCDK